MEGAALWSKPVLVVEDDPVIGELLTLRLDLAGYRPTWVRDGGAALGRINDVKPALVVLDLGLPVIDGFQVLKALRAEPRWQDLPIIVLTARHNSEDVRKALSLGASDYMAKPFDAKQLQQRIERQLQMRASPAKRAAPGR